MPFGRSHTARGCFQVLGAIPQQGSVNSPRRQARCTSCSALDVVFFFGQLHITSKEPIDNTANMKKSNSNALLLIFTKQNNPPTQLFFSNYSPS